MPGKTLRQIMNEQAGLQRYQAGQMPLPFPVASAREGEARTGQPGFSNEDLAAMLRAHAGGGGQGGLPEFGVSPGAPLAPEPSPGAFPGELGGIGAGAPAPDQQAAEDPMAFQRRIGEFYASQGIQLPAPEGLIQDPEQGAMGRSIKEMVASASQPGVALAEEPAITPDTAPAPAEPQQAESAFYDVQGEGDLERARAEGKLQQLGAFRDVAEGFGKLGTMTSGAQILSGLPQQKPYRAEGIREEMRRVEVAEDQRREQEMVEIAAGGAAGRAGQVSAQKALTAERKRILSDTRLRQLKSFRDAAGTVKSLVRSGNPLAAKNAAVKLARAMGDVGMLSNLDIQRWTKRPGWVGTVDQLVEFMTNAPAQGLLDQMHDTADEIYQHNLRMLDEERRTAIDSFKEFHPGAATEKLENLFGKERPQAEVTREGFVTMKHPRLGTMAVPKNKVNAALRKNWSRA